MSSPFRPEELPPAGAGGTDGRIVGGLPIGGYGTCPGREFWAGPSVGDGRWVVARAQWVIARSGPIGWTGVGAGQNPSSMSPL